MKITDFDIKISAENVCAFLDGDKTGDLYEEIMDELEEMLPQAYEKIRPVALLEFGDLEGYRGRCGYPYLSSWFWRYDHRYWQIS